MNHPLADLRGTIQCRNGDKPCKPFATGCREIRGHMCVAAFRDNRRVDGPDPCLVLTLDSLLIVRIFPNWEFREVIESELIDRFSCAQADRRHRVSPPMNEWR